MGKQIIKKNKRVKWSKVVGFVLMTLLLTSAVLSLTSCQTQQPIQNTYNIAVNNHSTAVVGSTITDSKLTSKPTLSTTQTTKPQLEQKQSKSDRSLMIVVIISIILIIIVISIWLYGRKKGWFK